MQRPTAQSTLTWAEDTALQRCNRSADPGAETEARAVPRSLGFLRFGISTKAKNLRGTTPRHADRMSSPQLTNADQPQFRFTLNQDTISSSLPGYCCNLSMLIFQLKTSSSSQS